MIKNKNYITLATDASTNIRDAIGCAYYIRDDTGTTKKAWHMNVKAESTDAEFVALAGALKVIASRNYPANTTLIYYGDNNNICRLVGNSFTTNRAKKNNAKRLEWVQKHLKGLEIDVRQVKAHTGKNDSKRFYMNRWVDFQARSMSKHQTAFRGQI